MASVGNGKPVNTNMYIPNANSMGLRRIALVNYSQPVAKQRLELNHPAFVLLDMSDLGYSYDVKKTQAGIVTRDLKDKDITMKVAVNFKPSTGSSISDNFDVPMSNTSIYDGLEDFLARLGPNRSTTKVYDRRGILGNDVPDLAIEWKVPTGGNAMKTRYRDVVITDIQWTEVSTQYQAIVVDLTLKPVGPWYYRLTNSKTALSVDGQVVTSLASSVFSANQIFVDDIDMDGQILYGLKIDPYTSGGSSSNRVVGCYQISNSYTNDTEAFYGVGYTGSHNDAGAIYCGNLRGTPYIMSQEQPMWGMLLPGSPPELYITPGGIAISTGLQFYFKWSTTQAANFMCDFYAEINVPIKV